MPQYFCPFCSHPLCGECRRLNSSALGHAQILSGEVRHGQEESSHGKTVRLRGLVLKEQTEIPRDANISFSHFSGKGSPSN